MECIAYSSTDMADMRARRAINLITTVIKLEGSSEQKLELVREIAAQGMLEVAQIQAYQDQL